MILKKLKGKINTMKLQNRFGRSESSLKSVKAGLRSGS